MKTNIITTCHEDHNYVQTRFRKHGHQCVFWVDRYPDIKAQELLKLGLPVVIIWDTESQFVSATIPPNALLHMTYMAHFKEHIPYPIFDIIRKFTPLSKHAKVPMPEDGWV